MKYLKITAKKFSIMILNNSELPKYNNFDNSEDIYKRLKECIPD